MKITATYSPEDNKLRLYASERLDPETYARVKEAGFVWAPKQQLFVAPKWSPAREDLATELAGEIEPEEMTLAERAALKAERLEGLAHKRHADANAFARRASEIAERFHMGQPILIGHHSERKARKDQERMQAASAKSAKLAETANYWLYRATGVEHFANMKNSDRTRANRIKTLLAELRDLQRDINTAHKAIDLWGALNTDEQIKHALGWTDSRALMAGYSLYSAVDKGELSPQDAKARCLANADRVINGPGRRRWIEHTLNRLAFERSLLGDVARYEGDITPVILQAFAREHGAEKPKATEIEPGSFELESPVPLPLHLASGRWLEMEADDWRDLMQSVGYEVPAPKPRRVSSKPAPASLVNPTAADAERLQAIWNRQMRISCAKGRKDAKENEVKTVSQAIYSRNSGGSYSHFETVEIDASGAIIRHHYSDTVRKVPVARIRIYSGNSDFYKPRAVVHISDKPAKALPLDFDAITAGLDAMEAPDEIAFAGPFDPAKVSIVRKRFSVTQGECEVSYNGKRINQFGDHVGFNSEGYPDSHWIEIARRFIEGERSLAA